jgi:hypothetical protein
VLEIYDVMKSAATRPKSGGDAGESDTCDVFISLRYCEALDQATLIKTALAEHHINAVIIDAENGEDIDKKIVSSIDKAKLCILMGSKQYGLETNSTFNTKQELQYILSEKKPYFIIKMCDRYELSTTRLKLNDAILYYPWTDAGPIPSDLIPKIVDKFTKL